MLTACLLQDVTFYVLNINLHGKLCFGYLHGYVCKWVLRLYQSNPHMLYLHLDHAIAVSIVKYSIVTIYSRSYFRIYIYIYMKMKAVS